MENKLRKNHYIENDKEYLYEFDYYFDEMNLCIRPKENVIYNFNDITPADSSLYKIYIQDKNNKDHYLVKVFKQKNNIDVNNLNYKKILNNFENENSLCYEYNYGELNNLRI